MCICEHEKFAYFKKKMRLHRNEKYHRAAKRKKIIIDLHNRYITIYCFFVTFFVIISFGYIFNSFVIEKNITIFVIHVLSNEIRLCVTNTIAVINDFLNFTFHIYFAKPNICV